MATKTETLFFFVNPESVDKMFGWKKHCMWYSGWPIDELHNLRQYYEHSRPWILCLQKISLIVLLASFLRVAQNPTSQFFQRAAFIFSALAVALLSSAIHVLGCITMVLQVHKDESERVRHDELLAELRKLNGVVSSDESDEEDEPEGLEEFVFKRRVFWILQLAGELFTALSLGSLVLSICDNIIVIYVNFALSCILTFCIPHCM